MKGARANGFFHSTAKKKKKLPRKSRKPWWDANNFFSIIMIIGKKLFASHHGFLLFRGNFFCSAVKKSISSFHQIFVGRGYLGCPFTHNLNKNTWSNPGHIMVIWKCTVVRRQWVDLTFTKIWLTFNQDMTNCHGPIFSKKWKVNRLSFDQD